MSVTMAKQGGPVQPEQSDMQRAMNVAKMPQGGFSLVPIKEMQQLIRNPQAAVQEHNMRGVQFPGHKKKNAAIQRHLAMIRENQMDFSLLCYNGTAKTPLLCWRPKGSGTPPLQLVPPLPGTPPALSNHSESSERTEIVGVPHGNVYTHTPLPKTQCLRYDANAKNSKLANNLIPDLLTDQEPSTGYHTICCVVMQPISMLHTKAA